MWIWGSPVQARSLAPVMSFSRVSTVAFRGIDAVPIDVQVHMESGLPGVHVVGLAAKSVQEATQRVRAAIRSIGCALPAKRITVNLAPADIQKDGSHYDLPIALAILQHLSLFPEDALDGCVIMGELSLDGQITPVQGVLPTAFSMGRAGMRAIVCPEANGPEASWAEDIAIIAAPTLLKLIQHLKGEEMLITPEHSKLRPPMEPHPDISIIKGQEQMKRVLEVTAAGMHNLLMIGHPGAGKSMLAACLRGILPDLTPQEILETTMIYSMAGKLDESGIVFQRPFRDPHHSASCAALVGGGIPVTPGEVSLSHNGILFLDELGEFKSSSLDALRQPLESGRVAISRAQTTVTYPAFFQLIAAMNPCKCGYLGCAKRQCRRAPQCGADYQSKISGPFKDRIGICVFVDQPDFLALKQPSMGEASKDIAKRVAAVHEIQRKRCESVGYFGRFENARIPVDILEKIAGLSADASDLIDEATQNLMLSARGYHSAIRLGRTIADLSMSKRIERQHIAEAISYRDYGS